MICWCCQTQLLLLGSLIMYMVQMVIKHVLGVGELHPSLYSKTSAYYGTVEQQR